MNEHVVGFVLLIFCSGTKKQNGDQCLGMSFVTRIFYQIAKFNKVSRNMPLPFSRNQLPVKINNNTVNSL